MHSRGCHSPRAAWCLCPALCCCGAQRGWVPCAPFPLPARRDWGIENFISPTLLRNMRGKDIKKAISYHLKRNQVLLDPRQKVECDPQARSALLLGLSSAPTPLVSLSCACHGVCVGLHGHLCWHTELAVLVPGCVPAAAACRACF